MHEKNVYFKVVFCITGIVSKLAAQEKKMTTCTSLDEPSSPVKEADLNFFTSNLESLFCLDAVDCGDRFFRFRTQGCWRGRGRSGLQRSAESRQKVRYLIC